MIISTTEIKSQLAKRKCDKYIQEMFEIFGCYFLVDQKRFVMAE